MLHRTPQRSYTSQSLERWFDRLNRDWEGYFRAEELQWGRRFYCQAEVRSTELLDSCAIVHFKRGKEPLYVIIDWNGEQPQFRESHPHEAPGHGLAVAGMYELEEFIADELPPVVDEQSGNGEIEEQSPTLHNRVFQDTPREGRQLRIRLMATSDGIRMEAGWKSQHREVDWSRFSLRDLNRWEREQLIGYTARAHRCGFRPADREGTYRMQDAGVIDRFFKLELKEWKNRFPVEEDPLLDTWRSGLKLLTPMISVVAAGLDARFKFDFGLRGSVVPEALRDRIIKSPGHTHFIPGKGIFQVNPKTLGMIHEWRSLLPSLGEGVLPRYLLFNFARDPAIQVRLSSELKKWQSGIEGSPGTSVTEILPDYLRHYQKEGVDWLCHLEAFGCPGLLADEMGLGKTLQVLNFLKVREALGTKPVLVVCPASVVPVWQSEIDKYFPDTPVRVLSRHAPLDDKVPALWIASYTQLRRNKQLLEGLNFDYAILDEAQSIKNPDAKVTHACLAIRSRFRIAITGTPMENRPLDLWTIFRFLMPGFLGGRHQFEHQARDSTDFVKRLRKQVAPFILRRSKAIVAADLPEKVEINWTCPLTDYQRRCYENLASGAISQFKGNLATSLKRDRMHLFALLTRLRQACCDPGLLPGETPPVEQSGKLLSLVTRLDEAFDGGSKVVVFSQFVQFLKRAKATVKMNFPNVPQFELTGATLDRDRPVQRFREEEGPAVFFISLKAGGTGLNLQVADYVFLLDPWWNPAVEEQAIDRVHRIGQMQRVIVYRMLTKGTIEDRIQTLKQAKGQLFDDLLSGMDAPSDLFREFSSLDDLIRLSEPSG